MAAILRAVLSMSAATVLSRITGLARTLAQAATLGTGLVAGSYALSNTLPNQSETWSMTSVLMRPRPSGSDAAGPRSSRL